MSTTHAQPRQTGSDVVIVVVSGVRLAMHAAHRLIQEDGKLALIAACAAGGQVRTQREDRREDSAGGPEGGLSGRTGERTRERAGGAGGLQ